MREEVSRIFNFYSIALVECSTYIYVENRNIKIHRINHAEA